MLIEILLILKCHVCIYDILVKAEILLKAESRTKLKKTIGCKLDGQWKTVAGYLSGLKENEYSKVSYTQYTIQGQTSASHVNGK